MEAAINPRTIAPALVAIGLTNIVGSIALAAFSAPEETRARSTVTERLADLPAAGLESDPPASPLDNLTGTVVSSILPGLASTEGGEQASGSTTSSSTGAPAPAQPQSAAQATNTPAPGLSSLLEDPLEVIPTVVGGVVATVLPATPTAVQPAATSPAPTTAIPTATATPAPAVPTATATSAPPTPVNDVLVATDYPSLSAAVAATQEGQTLRVPAGEYRVKGPVYPRSNTTFRFESGSLVIFTGSNDGFVFDGVANVRLEGMRSYHESGSGTGRNIRTMGASNITLIDIVVERSGSIGVSIDYSDDVLIDGYVNTDEAVHPGNHDDALNIRNSRNVTVRNFDLFVADDAISLKTMGNFSGETSNILIEDGVIRSRDSGIAFGTEIAKPIRNVTIRDVEFVDSGNPIYFKRNDEKYQANVENVRIEGIRTRGSGIQRFVFVYAKSGTADSVRDLTLRNCDFEGDTQFQDFYFPNNDPATNGIVFENVTVNGKAAQP